jgi:iron complex outermembrane receptor protein
VYRTEIAEQLTTLGAEAGLSAEDTLRELLRGTGLVFATVNDRTFAIYRASGRTPRPANHGILDSPSDPSRPDINDDVNPAGSGGDGNVKDKGDKTVKHRGLIGRIAGALSLAIATLASAADGADGSESGSNKNSNHILEEVVVTAQKREERLIDTQQSVTVLSSNDLTKLGATQFRDFASTVPGLSFTTTGAGNTQISMRGVTTGYDVSSTTATYVDEVPYGSSTTFANNAQLGLDPALFGLDRIEVLRGPQGTLYGASAMGGLIKYVSKLPDASRLGYEVQTSVSSTRHGGFSYNGNGAINVPVVTDKAGLRVSGFEAHDGGYIDNLARHRNNVDRSDVYGARVDLLLAPVEPLTIRITGLLQNISRDGEATADYTSAGARPYGVLGQNRSAGEPFDQHFRVASGTVTYDLGPATLTSVSSYQTVRTDFVWDLSAIYVPFLNAPPPNGFGRSYSVLSVPGDSRTNKFTQEVRLASVANQKLEWLVGGFYTREKSSLFEVFAPLDLAGQPAPNDLFTYLLPSTYEEYAAFGDLTWHFSDKFDVTGGVRYARNHQSIEQLASGAFGVPGPNIRSSDSVLTYLANARYHFTDHATGYVRYATGYRPGGPAYVTIDPATGQPNGPPTFGADTLKSYEVGFKAETENRAFGVDLSAYYIDWSNLQVSFNNNGFSSIHNAAGGAGIRGAELALTGRPTSTFIMTSSLAYQDAKLLNADLDLHAAKGERLPNVPEFTASITADYELSLTSLRPTLGATVRYVDHRKSAFGSGAYPLPDYTTVDLRTGAVLGAVNVQLYVRNLFDEHGQVSVAYPQFGGRVAIQQPRTIGITATMSF